jgi:Na+/proline symporter/nitrogen-specific signal transduction histidine kinase
MFFIAYWAEKNKTSKLVKSPYIYALSLAVYCSAWTYYGSIGVAARSGIEFLAIYLGPVIAAPLWIYILQKIIRLSKVYNISSIADFISLRYGNNRSVGAIVTLICALSVIPYISLQLKAVSESFNLLSGTDIVHNSSLNLFSDTTFYIAIILAIFAAFYGTINYDASQEKKGIFFAISIESIVKLFVFVGVGIYTCFYIFDSPAEIISKANAAFDTSKLTQINTIESGVNWWFTIFLSFIAIFLLPRQFQASVVEYKDKKQLTKAIWFFPLYLLIFNVFVVFIAFAGKLKLGENVNADYYSILLPLHFDDTTLATIVFIGGFSAIISMVVVSTLALSTMLSNNLIIPYGFIKVFKKNEHEKNQKTIKNIRRISVFCLITLAFLLYRFFNPQTPLFSIGLLSFLLVAQLAPSFFIGLFWNRGSALGAKTGMLVGLAIVVISYVLPFFQTTPFNTIDVQEAGILNVFTFQFEKISFLSPINSCLFWSLSLNIFFFMLLSLVKKGNYRERNYGEVFVNSSSAINLKEDSFVWKGDANTLEIFGIWKQFLGEKRAFRALDIFKKRYKIEEVGDKADARFINFSEKLLTGAIGSASSRILINTVAEEHEVSLNEVLSILEENKKAMEQNKLLIQKSDQLFKLSEALKQANISLKKQDKLKDDFLNAVAHELKTPITSIQASSEVLKDNPDIDSTTKEQFLDNIIIDTHRITKLINDILNLEKLASGREKLQIERHDISAYLKRAISVIKPLAIQKGVSIQFNENETFLSPFDKDKMLQVFVNILSNALKFVEPKTGKIEIALTDFEDFTKITFKDNGSGIPEIDRPYIFDKFYQSDQQAFKKNEGSGFGLAICKQIIELHKGKIYTDETFSDGACFIIELPKVNTNEEYTNS